MIPEEDVDETYEELADALNRLPNGFPRTDSNIEIKLLKKMYSPQQAAVACRLSSEYETVDVIAERLGIPVKDARSRLMNMVKRGFAWFDRAAGTARFRLAPFIVGSYEAQLHDMDHEFAHLFEEYMAAGGAVGIMKPLPSIHRVVPAQGTVKQEWIVPYDNVRAMLEDAKTYHVRDCICRVQQDLVGRRNCEFPLKNCLSFSKLERPARPGDISQEQALAILEETEKVGLVHTVSNIMEGVNYICNCCGCCCGILRGITEYGMENSVAAANYYAMIDDELCQACGVCSDRCQVNAVTEKSGTYRVIREKCIGCGLCVTGCPHDAVKLIRKPEADIIQPPEDFAHWESERSKNRGLT
jgi:ferredoxin